ncbi:hypothetical protein EON83_01305 [bacterium]|nr:MAG: hypothetical protein EON83_01305 [bacterium]
MLKSTSSLIILGLAWLFLVTAGLGFTLNYEATPGVAATASDWPVASHLQLATNKATLLVMAHPQCPCTRATIEELNNLLASCQDKVQVNVLFWKPKGYPKNWEQTALWRAAAAIPGVKVVTDEGGVEAHRFHASTSGQVFLFNPTGKLIFSGGITAGRGHIGDNAGRDAIVSLLTTGKAERQKTFVYGCSLFNQGSRNPSP